MKTTVFGTLLPTLETIIKKVVAVQADLSSMTIGLAGAIEMPSDIVLRKCFKMTAILAAVTSPKFKLKGWNPKTIKICISRCLFNK